MADSLTAAPRRIFIIGPMSKEETDAQGLTLDQHIPNLSKATEAVLERLAEKHGDEMRPWQVNIPRDSAGRIPHHIFSHIMHCDFAIADISTKSPNVMYELAMLHANGVPVILIGPPVFYLNQDNCVDVANFEVETLTSALSGGSFDADGQPGQIEQLLFGVGTSSIRNPISDHFDGVHLVNVAAATGIATGYFYNFLQYVLKEGGIFKSRPELIDIVLIRPGRIKDVDRAVGFLQQKFGEPQTDRNGNEIIEAGVVQKEIPDIMQPDPAHPRNKYFVRRIGNHLVDYPTPISSLSVSKQVQMVARFLQENSTGFSEDEFPPFEKRLIDIYFSTLEDLADASANNCDWGRVRVLSLEEALDYLAV